VALLSLDAVVGVKGRVAADGTLESVGITCALCHSIVDDAVAPGIGRRLDGYPNRDLDPGLILSLSPAFSEAQKQVLRSWGKGRYDPRWSIDGINAPVLIPPAYGLKHVGRETYTGDGPISYWNAYVAVTQMGGQGVFIDPRIGVAVIRRPDRVTPKLPALVAYQLSLEAPPAPASSFDESAAERGRQLFRGKAKCASCHFGSVFTDARYRLHRPERVGQDPLYASRSATKRYRTTPLRGAWQHPPYFHDGSAATFDDVVEHYDSHFQLQLTDPEKADLTEYLQSL
jgi:mono/diheme cytochrome c family protein